MKNFTKKWNSPIIKYAFTSKLEVTHFIIPIKRKNNMLSLFYHLIQKIILLGKKTFPVKFYKSGLPTLKWVENAICVKNRFISDSIFL